MIIGKFAKQDLQSKASQKDPWENLSLPGASSTSPVVDGAVPLVTSGLAIGVWLAVAYALIELSFGVTIAVDKALMDCASEM